jgi:hypothetical protein
MNSVKGWPEWANWRSVDKDGTVVFWSHRPLIVNNRYVEQTIEFSKCSLSTEREFLNQYQLDNWPNGMLTERPKPKQEDYYGMDLVETEAMKKAKSMNKYNRLIKGQVGASCVVDVYDVLKAFEVTNPATQHAIKKLLASGQRGYKDKQQDLNEAIASLKRAIELESEQ